MKTNTFVKELRGKSVEELNQELVAAKKELFNLRFQNATNQLDNTSRIKEVRKNNRTYPDDDHRGWTISGYQLLCQND
mgnify:CR=1 FL=1